jgi:hypothetical protein
LRSTVNHVRARDPLRAGPGLAESPVRKVTEPPTQLATNDAGDVTREEQRISFPATDIPSGCSFPLISMSVLIRIKAAATATPERCATPGSASRTNASSILPDRLERLGKALHKI